MSMNSNQYYYHNNPNKLSNNSQVYQPSNSGYDSQMNGDRKSPNFIPGITAGNQGGQDYGPGQGPPKKINNSGMGNPQGMAGIRNGPGIAPQDPMGSQGQWSKMNPQPSNRGQPYPESGMMHEPMGNPGMDQRVQGRTSPELEKICQYIMYLRDPVKKYDYFKELNNQRDNVPQLAPILWYSTGTVAILLQEIINIYPNLSPPTLTQAHSERICNVLGLFQCIALHNQTKPLFIQANLHLYLYPLISKTIRQRPFENLRVTSLGVIGALVKGEESETISYLINTELIVLCLRIMKKGNELSRTVATFIVQKILMDENGLHYVCQTEERLLALAQILKDIIEDIAREAKADKDGQRLLRHIMRCLLRLSEDPKANERLAEYIPDCIRNSNNDVIKDEQVRKWYFTLMRNLRLI